MKNEIDINSLPKTRTDALKKDSIYYYTGKQCVHGHVAPRSVGGGCVECRRTQNNSQYGWGNYLYIQTYYKKHPAKKMLNQAKARAKRNNINFNITIDDINIPDICPVLGLTMKQQTGRAKDNSPTLDRIDSTKGYVKGNVVVVSWKANRIKSNATVAELKLITEYYISINKDKQGD